MKLEDLSPPVTPRLRRLEEESTLRIALKAATTAAHLLGLAAGVHLRQLRAMGDPLAEATARLREAELRARYAWELLEIVLARFAKLPEKHRPHYTPPQRFRLLEIMQFFGWSADRAARFFLVCANTVGNWQRQIDPVFRTVGSCVKPVPPIRRFADVVRATIQTAIRSGFGGDDMVSLVVGRTSWTVSARSVRRIRRTVRPLPPVPSGPDTKPYRPVVARFVHHVWMMDVTVVKALFGGEFRIAAVYDAFSRIPLAVQSFDRVPHACDMARLLKVAVRAFGKPRYMITDRGKEFRAKPFAKTLSRLGILQRFASKDNHHATARLERFWRTLKLLMKVQIHAPLTLDDLEATLTPALTYYVCFRPHQGLQGATPAEAFLGIEPAIKRAVSPPRGRPGEGPAELRFAVEYLDDENRAFPILKRAA